MFFFSARKPGQFIQLFTMSPCIGEVEVFSGLNVAKVSWLLTFGGPSPRRWKRRLVGLSSIHRASSIAQHCSRQGTLEGKEPRAVPESPDL